MLWEAALEKKPSCMYSTLLYAGLQNLLSWKRVEAISRHVAMETALLQHYSPTSNAPYVLYAHLLTCPVPILFIFRVKNSFRQVMLYEMLP